MQSANELINTLKQEKGVYDSVLKIAEDKTDIIIKGKVDELDKMLKQEQELVLQMAKLEDARERLVAKIFSELGITDKDMTISTLVEAMKSPYSSGLKECQSLLLDTIGRLKVKNDLNSKLIKNSLEYINFSINLIASVDSGSNNYSGSGQVSDAKKRNFFDMKL
ncbi:FlgN protein [Anaerobacterium chartisolvens]|uniref:FlgN protein n=1 Tax=Anaerobacterium chartisolvens TaxID=1297424 RepID=A0A369B2V6_9FIRM|nr:flagellar protein FlgN [Anaerobacterium chartisolvens]RCX14776.1 FlgN protein [Anaerobacterium chartisolvens]